MPHTNDTRETMLEHAHYLRAGWALLVGAILALAVPVLITAAQPHVLWLFSMSYGAVALVVGITLLRMAHEMEMAPHCGEGLEGCRS